jgi:hypothetical protein
VTVVGGGHRSIVDQAVTVTVLIVWLLYADTVAAINIEAATTPVKACIVLRDRAEVYVWRQKKLSQNGLRQTIMAAEGGLIAHRRRICQ